MSILPLTDDEIANAKLIGLGLDGSPPDKFESVLARAATEIEQLRADLEKEQMRLAACSVVALANTEETAKKARDSIHPDYRSAAMNDVANAVDREMALRAEIAAKE